MNIYPFMKDERYVEIVKKLTKAYKHAVNQRKMHVVKEKIKKDSTNSYKELLKELNDFHTQKKAEIEAEQHRIRRAYKNKKKEYIDPQEEQLRRQDFETELMIMNDGELKNVLKDKDKSFTDFEINRMMIEFKNRGMNSEANELSVLKYARKKEYESDPNYEILEQEKSLMTLIRNKGDETSIYLPSSEGRPKIFMIREIEYITTENPHRKMSNFTDKIGLLEKSCSTLEQNIQSTKEWEARYNKQVEQEKQDYVDYMESINKPIKQFKFEDDDVRAVRDSQFHDIEVEFGYLKERYHDNSNYMYSAGNPDYDIHKHLNYLRDKHQQRLNKDTDLLVAIRNKLEQATNEATQDDE